MLYPFATFLDPMDWPRRAMGKPLDLRDLGTPAVTGKEFCSVRKFRLHLFDVVGISS